jgi:hypothetical protein
MPGRRTPMTVQRDQWHGQSGRHIVVKVARHTRGNQKGWRCGRLASWQKMSSAWTCALSTRVRPLPNKRTRIGRL